MDDIEAASSLEGSSINTGIQQKISVAVIVELLKMNTITEKEAEEAIQKLKESRDFSYSEDDKKWLRGLEIDSINDYLSIIEALNDTIDRLKREIKREARKDEDTKLVMTIPGIGFIWGLTITTEIGDVGRFPGPKKLCSYAGLVPSTEQSGSKEVHGSITKEGNKYLRWAMVECSWSHLQHGEDTHLIRFFKRLAKKKTDQVAIVAMARKMLTVIYWMLKRKEEFRPQG